MKQLLQRAPCARVVLTACLILAACGDDEEPAGPAVTITQLTYTGMTFAALTPDMEQIRTIGTFTKASASTRLEVVWNSAVTGVAATADGTCTFQVRLDRNASTPYPDGNGTGATFGSGSVGLLPIVPVSTTDVFMGVAAGVHEVTLWAMSIGMTTCIDNPGNYVRWVVVTEY